MFDFWPVYSGERFRASWPSCFYSRAFALKEISSQVTNTESVCLQKDILTKYESLRLVISFCVGGNPFW